MMLPTLLGFGPLGGGIFLGWTLGANDAANVFGTAVATRIISFKNAAIMCGVAVIIGAFLQGQEGIKTLSGLTSQTIFTAVIISISAAATGALMTYMRIPISTSQAVVGAILGIGLATGHIEYSGLKKIVLCWVGTPIGAMVIALIVYKILSWIIQIIPMSMLTRDKIIWSGLLAVGAYGSYALGANNVTNSTGIFSGLIDGVSDRHLSLIGGVAIAVGVLTYSKRVIMAVGAGVVTLDAFAAFVAVLSMSITVHVFAVVGAPVSTSQGIVGALLGIGFIRGCQNIKLRVLGHIGLGWVLTPVMSLMLAAAGYAIFSA